jgi:hypothetical protein
MANNDRFSTPDHQFVTIEAQSPQYFAIIVLLLSVCSVPPW